MGKNHDLKLPLAVNYLPFLGTEKYTPAELQQEFFKLGISMGVYAGNDRSYVYITGLQESLDPGLELLEHVIANVEPDKSAYDEYVKGILKKRKDRKLSKSSILWGGLFNYGMYGEKSPYTHLISEDNLKAQDPEELTGLLKDLYSYKHKVFYYGSMPLTKIMRVIEKHHKVPEELKTYPDPVKFVELETNENKVYFVDYDMVQVNIIMMSKDEKLNMSLLPEATLFNEYFGGGLSSIVFQEIRESRALAYSVFAAFNIPAKRERSHFTYGFVGTQADKLQMAIYALLDLMNDMPKAGKQFDLAKESIMKKIESERITKTNIYSTYIRNLDRGVNYDTRKDVYEAMKTMSLDELDKFFMEHIAGKNYTFLVLGDRDAVDMNVLKELGTIREIKPEEIFGH